MKNRIVISTILLFSIGMFFIWASMFTGYGDARLWHAFLINYLYFTSLAAGLVVWPAIVIGAHGSWMEGIEKFCYAGLFFSIPSLLALIVLWIGSRQWAPWVNQPESGMLWLNNTFLFSRNMIFQVLFWVMAFVFYKKRYSQNFRSYAYILIVVYVISFSLLGFDFLMTLAPGWYSMMIGGYFFITGVYVSSAAWALMVALSGQGDKSQLHALGKLIIAFCIFTFYLMFSHLFPIWYGNNPKETLFLIPKMNFEWRWISYLLLLLLYLGPIPFLLSAKVKKNAILLGIISLVIIVAMWIEKWWMVSSVFERKQIIFGWPEIIPTFAFLAVLVAGIRISRYNLTRFTDLEINQQ